MPHSPTGSVLAFEHPKDLGRQVATLEVQRLLMNKDVDIWAGTPTYSYSSFSSFVIFASSFRVSSHLSQLQPHFELIKFLNLTGFTVCKFGELQSFLMFYPPRSLGPLCRWQRCNISLIIAEPFDRRQHWNLARGTEGSLEVGTEGSLSLELGSLNLEVDF